jgi:nucleoid-associated protein YgaU
MGLFDFMKDAGKKMDTHFDLAKEVYDTGIEVENLYIKHDAGTITVNGSVKTQADREKVILALGNIEGIEKVDDLLEVAESETEARFYTVKSGDTLSKIAQEYYGNAMKYMEIFEANTPMLKNPDLIYPGQVLRIPKLEE